MSPRPPDEPPLLSIGMHRYEIPQIQAEFVDSFPASTTRQSIMDGLTDVVTQLSNAGVEGELWIDGSFLTQKVDAKDSDVVLRVSGDFYDNASGTTRDAMDWLNSNLYLTHKCDSYLFMDYPEGHPNYWEGQYMRAYWIRQWGFSRQGEMKGIVLVELPYSGPYN